MKIFCVRKGKAIRLAKKYKNKLIDEVAETLSWTKLNDNKKRELAAEYVDSTESLVVYIYNHDLHEMKGE